MSAGRAENDQEHGRQILVEVADRLLDNLTAGLVLFTTGQILKRVDEYDAATPLSGAFGSCSSRSSPSRLVSVG